MTSTNKQTDSSPDNPVKSREKDQPDTATKKTTAEIGGRKGPEPTRYGDWEKNGIISDF